ncbi:SRPBCC family protein [Micromonospora sp. NPDC050397]|uniref:SRPBCC family protein n=1 Tax=Micromonospora sp. NPDC050397 TaxID=3364279 RepID=UPI00384E6552
MTVQKADKRLATAEDITSILVRNCGLNAESAAAAPTASLEELGMDSLALLELQAVVADRYQVQIPEEVKHLSIADIAELVDRQAEPPLVPTQTNAPPTVTVEPAAGIEAAVTTEPAVTTTGPAAGTGPAEPAATVGAGVPGPAEPAQDTDPPGHTENSVVILAPRQLVWELTNDVGAWPNLFTEYQLAEVLEQRGNRVLFRLTMFPDENGIAWSWVSERTMNPEQFEVHARRVETGPFAYMRIYWRYDEVPGGTRMTWVQDFAMKPTAPVDNRQMTERINTNSRIQLNLIRDRIELAARERALDVPNGGDDE